MPPAPPPFSAGSGSWHPADSELKADFLQLRSPEA